MITAPHHNQQVFSDYYLDILLPQRQDWQELLAEAEPVRQELATIFARYKPGDKEAQAEHDFIRPVLIALGHTFEVQASLATPDGTKQPDYIFYRDVEALNANKGKRLTDTLLQSGAFAVGDAKYWDCPLDMAIRDRGGDPFTNKNPSYQIAFYIQHSGLQWGILTNGRLWRLYHKSTAHKLDHFYEVDLPALLESAETRDFLYFYAFFRRAAFDAHPPGVAEILRESIEYALGVSNSLKDQVYTALRHVAQGFLDFAPNHLSPDDPTTLKAIYDSSLIMLYRLLFILYAEARDLLPISNSDLYRENYSLRFIAHYTAKNLEAGRILRSNSSLIYFALKNLFGYINAGDPPLKISTFNGGLFDPQRASNLFLETYQISDARLQQAIDLLTRTCSNGSDERHFIDYRDLSVRNLGSIYEGLLEYHLENTLDLDGWTIDLLNDKGERKATGSYYTPDYIVKYLVDATVGPMLAKAVQGAESEKTRIEAVLALKVLDPSMGSGHFLVEATEYIARFLVELNAHPETSTRDADLAYWKRRVVQACIYGVDLNPLAVELAKLSLWLSTVARERPLSFLDHHLRTGNALIGARLANLTYARNGNGKNGNGHEKNGNGHNEAQLSLFDDDTFRQNMTTAVDLMWLVEDSPAQTVEQVKEQEHIYTTMRQGLIGKYGNLANLVTSTSYGLALDMKLWKPLVDFATGRIDVALPAFQDWVQTSTIIANARRFFHWELEFPEVFFDRQGQAKQGQAGFDVVIGNPPWIRQEMFSEDKAALKRFYNVYHGVADLSTYFVELGNTFLKDEGRFGYIIPNKFVRANYGSALRQFLTSQVKLERIVDFGDLPIFTEAVTYPMIVLTSRQPIDETPVKYTRIRKLDPANLAATIEAGESSIPRTALSIANWSLDGAGTQSIIEQMKAVSIPLAESIQGKVYRGILTGLNEAFVIDQRTRDRLIAADEKSEEIIKPFVVGEDVKRYFVEYHNRYVIFTKRGIDINRYPAISKYLLQFRAKLEPKPANWDEVRQGEWPGRKPGPYQWYEIQDTIAYHEEFEKPKIMFPDIAKRCQFAYDTESYFSGNTTYIMPIDADQKYLLPLLNSSLVEFFFQTISAQIRGGYLRFIYQYVTQIPIRRITFITPGEERAALVTRATTYYESGRREELLALVEACLANQPEQSDVVHDLLIYLAEQMIDLHKQRARSLENFMLALESVLSDADLQRLGRLWTPPPALKATLFDENEPDPKAIETQEKLGALASRQLDLRDDIGALNEEQWKWLAKRRLNKPDLVELTKIFRARQPAIAALDKRIATTDRLIDQLVYRLYGLTDEEMTTVEARGR